MKKFKIFLLCALITVSVSGVAVFAANYDSSEDPIVTLSYIQSIFKPQVDNQISETEKKLTDEINSLKSEIELLKSQISSGAVSTTETEDSENQGGIYEVLELKKGDTLTADSPCEVILRAGQIQVVSPYAEQGIGDYTSGTDLFNGTNIDKNHLLIIPRGGDGRGITVTSDSAFVMVRGEYSIANQ